MCFFFFLLLLLAPKIFDDVTVVNEISLDDIIENLVKKILRDKCLRTDPRNDLESKDNLQKNKNKNVFTYYLSVFFSILHWFVILGPYGHRTIKGHPKMDF